MQEDLIVTKRTQVQLNALAMDWRRSLDIGDVWAPEIVGIFEQRLPTIIDGFELIAQDDRLFHGKEGYAIFPKIFIPKSTREKAVRWDGRSRMTVCHEFGHLVLHPDAQLPRMVDGNRPAPIADLRRSAEWQARKFAAFFLMPDHIVREFQSAIELAEHCKVSRQAAELRFAEVGHVRRELPPSIKQFIEEMRRRNPRDERF
jgi:Zn-dependent peptidase ImmA (M78 family)